MQEVGAQISDACWNVKMSKSGLSVSFFWPSSDGRSKASQPQQKSIVVGLQIRLTLRKDDLDV